MTLKDKLQQIFHSDYPGIATFIEEVIIPIMGDEIDYINTDIATRPEYAEKAAKAGIKKLIYVADITEQNYSSQNIALFDVTIENSVNVERARVNIQQLIRSVVGYYNHILIVFHYEDPTDRAWRFSYAHKIDSQANTTSAKRYTYVFGRDFRARTAAERFNILAGSPKRDKDFEDAFSVQALSDEFFDLYRAYYAAFVEFITGEKYSDEKKLNTIISRWNWLQKDNSGQYATTFNDNAKDVRDYIKKMFGRIVFLYFLQRKGWLYDSYDNPDSRYMQHLFDRAGDYKDTFLDNVLELLFFYVLNTKPEQRVQEASLAHKDITILPGWEKIPFLNGGLFSQDEFDPKRCVFPAVYFESLFNFLDSYNFTIDENDQEDAEVGIDPEMLGRIFENLLEDNKDKGAFYTPKEIVDYMCRESIIAYLQDDKFTVAGNQLIRSFVEKLDREGLSDNQRIYLRDKLKSVKICDPAIGSGAFPMGLVNLLAKLYIALGISTTQLGTIKRHIMEQNIYGVDIEKGAVDIARLRFWLAMIVEEKEPIPLPNLHFKIMQGNSLLETYRGTNLSRLTEINIGEPGGLGFQNEEAKSLISSLERFYNESDHGERNTIFNDIVNNVRRQIHEITQSEEFMTDISDLSANDKFFLWHTWFVDVFTNGGFDIIIGNPPYLTEGKAPKKIFEEVKDDPYYLGKMNIWYMFACQGIDMLKPGGNLCFIATNNWVTSTGAKKLRNKIITDTRILQLCDFHDYKIFDTADIQTMIMQFQKDSISDDYSFDLRNLLGTTLSDVTKLLEKKVTSTSEYLSPQITRRDMLNRYLTFSANDILLSKIRRHSDIITLNDSEVTQGIVPNPDMVNKRNIKRISREDISKFNIKTGNPVFIIPKDFFSTLSEHERTFIKPIYEPTDLYKYSLGSSSYDIIYLTKHNAPDPTLIPTFVNHLDKFRPIMDERRETANGRIAYYQLHWPREQSIFENGAKLLVPRKCATPCFTYTEDVAYVMMAINVIKTQRVNIKFLGALLNSKLIEFWLRNRGKMQGLNFQLDKEPLQQIPIVVAPINIQQYLASRLDSLMGNNPLGIDSLSIIQEIDHIVYHLYDLTYDEVLIIDPETPITHEEYASFQL